MLDSARVELQASWPTRSPSLPSWMCTLASFHCVWLSHSLKGLPSLSDSLPSPGHSVVLPTSPTVFRHLTFNCPRLVCFLSFISAAGYLSNQIENFWKAAAIHFLSSVWSPFDLTMSLSLFPSLFLFSFTPTHSGNLFVGYLSSCLNRNDPLKEPSVCVHKTLALAFDQPVSLLALACPDLRGC